MSRFHCEVRTEKEGVVIRDLGSRNGTVLDGTRVMEGFVRAGATERQGRVAITFGAPPATHSHLSLSTEFGGLSGTSAPMRAVFAVLERAARSSSTVLLDGETGTGKGEAALALHKASDRADCPFVVVDCGSIPANLFESELFGYEKGAFTGAESQRVGAFETAQGGTIFLDEVGELPLDVQPKLLRVLEERHFRRLGSARMHPLDVRVIAATNRDLRNAVNHASFRADLYFRLAVVRARLPPLRERLEDLPLIVARLADALGGSPEQIESLISPQSLAALRRNPWLGNVRELRNHIERALVLPNDRSFGHDDTQPLAPGALGTYQVARQRALASFEHHYLQALITRHEGKVAPAAEAAGLSRVHPLSSAARALQAVEIAGYVDHRRAERKRGSTAGRGWPW